MKNYKIIIAGIASIVAFLNEILELQILEMLGTPEKYTGIVKAVVMVLAIALAYFQKSPQFKIGGGGITNPPPKK